VQVASYNNKIAKLPEKTYNRYRVLKKLLYKLFITCKTRKKNNTLTNIICTNIIIKNCIRKAIIHVRIKVYLISIKLIKRRLLIRSKYINNILLKETRAIK